MNELLNSYLHCLNCDMLFKMGIPRSIEVKRGVKVTIFDEKCTDNYGT